MKTVRLCAVSLLFYGSVAAWAAADPADDGAASSYEPGSQPQSYSETETKPKQLSPEDRARAQEQAEEKNDWLMRGYIEQAQARALAEGSQNSLYSDLSADKDVAKSLGLPTTAPGTDAAAADLRTGAKAGASSLNLRPDMPAPAAPAAPKENVSAASLLFKPFNALGSDDVAGLHDVFASLPPVSPGGLASPGAADSGSLEVPGMVAAEADPTKRASLDLTLDPLPGEAAQEEEEQQAHHSLALDLPPGRNAEQIQKQRNAALLVPGRHATLSPAPINPLLLKPVDDTALMVPDPSPVRGQVADPYDILR